MKLIRTSTPVRPPAAEGPVTALNTAAPASSAFVAPVGSPAARTTSVMTPSAQQRPRNAAALQSSSFGGVGVASTPLPEVNTMSHIAPLAAASGDLRQALHRARQMAPARQPSPRLTPQKQLERTALQLVKHPQWGAALTCQSIAQMEKILGTSASDRKFVEVAASLFGPGSRDLIGKEEPIDEVIGKLGYATTEGVNSLCDVKEDCDQLTRSRQSANDATDDDIGSAQADNAGLSRAEQKALEREQQSVALALKRAIHGGQKLGNVIADKAHQCHTIDAIRAVCEVKDLHDRWLQSQRHA
jgi:hypothetical protein